MDNTPIERKPDWLKTLAFEVALEYFTPEELCLQYGLSDQQYKEIAQLPKFQQWVLDNRREIDEQGTQFKVLARKLSAVTLPTLYAIAQDEDVEPATRIRAVETLAKLAGFDKQEDGGGHGFQVNIQVNT
jgi:hypothetical protein